MADPHLDHPGEVSWFPGQKPARVLGPCPHTSCPHNAGSAIAWGPDFEHYTLDRCDVGPEVGGCDGTCRAWAAEVPITEGRRKGRVAYSWGAWQHVDVPPRSAKRAEPRREDLPGRLVALTVHDDVVAAITERAGTLADRLAAEPNLPGRLTPEEIAGMTAADLEDVYRLGVTVAITATLEELTGRGWMIVAPQETPHG